ncbi:MAG: D-alanine--D-alanine ligase family protein, partial [Solirubrobacterales bacterium]
MNVAVLKGGSSLERGVSLRSGARVEEALRGGGHQVISLDAEAGLTARLKEERPDVVFIALHGPGGEDGTIQELLEILGLPYVGPGVAACIRCMDKVIAKHEMRSAGVPTPDWVAFTSEAFSGLGAADAFDEIEAKLGLPVVVKPAAQGSSLGVKVVTKREEVPEALISALSYGDRVLIERYVRGRELAVSVIDGEPLPTVEAVPKGGEFFDFEARYEIGRTEYLCPAELTEAENRAVRETALRTWDVLGVEGYARVDLILAANEDAVEPD